MNPKIQGTFAIIAALLVLFSAMWDPRISVMESIVCLASIGIFGLVQHGK